MPSPGAARVRAFDWLRGLAVVVMVECHALVVTRPELRTGIGFGRLNFLNGLVAPAFILAAGFSLAYVQVKGAHGPRQARVKKTLRRIGEVLAVGTLINIIWFPILKEPQWLLRMDILQCIGFSLLLALPVLVGLARRPLALAAAALLLAALAFGGAPYVEHVRGPWAALLNRNGSTQSVFPLLPWAGYVMLGAAVGAVAALGRPGVLKLFLLALTGVGALLWSLAPVFLRVLPTHVFWISDPANHGERWFFVCLALVGLLVLEERLSEGAQKAAPFRFLLTLGTSSLAAYFFHEMLLFFRFFGVSVETLFKDRLSWGAFVAVYVPLLAATTALAKLADRLYPRWDALFRRSPPAPP